MKLLPDEPNRTDQPSESRPEDLGAPNDPGEQKAKDDVVTKPGRIPEYDGPEDAFVFFGGGAKDRQA
jgi:hypothetical protein